MLRQAKPSNESEATTTETMELSTSDAIVPGPEFGNSFFTPDPQPAVAKSLESNHSAAQQDL